MRGSLRERRPGHWQLRVYAGPDLFSGKKQWITETVTGGKREAQRRLAQLVAEVDAGKSAPTDATLDVLVARFLEHGKTVRGWSPTTSDGYLLKLRHVCEVFGKHKLGAIRPDQLDAYYERRIAQLSLRGSRNPGLTVRHEHRVLSTAFHQAVRWGWMDRNPCDRATPPSAQVRDVGAPEVATVQAAIEAATASRNDARAPLLTFIALTGMRRGEVCGLRWSDVDHLRSQVAVQRSVIQPRGQGLVVRPWPKTKKPRLVALDELGKAVLAERLLDCQAEAAKAGTSLGVDSYVWSDDPDGATPLKPGTLTQYVSRLGRRLGVTMGPHQFRHFAATFLIGEGHDLRTIAGRLGHDPVVLMRIYAHRIAARDHAAAESIGRALGAPAPPTAT